LECCTIRTVVPTGGKVTPALLLGWASADFSAAETECVALALAVDVADDAADEAEDDPVLAAEEAEPWVAAADAAPVVEVVELDDPPHAVSSSASELSPVATVHPLLRITCLSLQGDPGSGSRGVMPGVSRWT
jgi:hypothetical protein